MIINARESGKSVIGICGGYQMMGIMISDPDGVEGDIRQLRIGNTPCLHHSHPY